MGFLDWRGWDRLDEVDRRLGLRPEMTEARIRRTARMLWLFTAVIAASAVLNLFGRNWGWAIADAALAVAALFYNRWAIGRMRDRSGVG